MQFPEFARGAAAALVLTSLSAAAAAAPAAAELGPGSRPAPLEELVVTARKRPEAARDVPTSLTVLDGELLSSVGAQSLDDVALRLPNFATDSSPLTGFGARYVRGLNAGARNIGFDSGYAVFVDGVYGGRYLSADRILQDVARIEYLPGPQGTLFGKNTTLGVINIVTDAPPPQTAARATLGVGSDGQRALRATASTPLGDGWSAAAAAGRAVRDGLVENRELDLDGNDVDRWDGRLAVAGDIGGWRTRVAADVFRSTPRLIARQRLEGLGALPPRVAGNDLPGRLDDRDYGVSLSAERDFGRDTVTAISAYRAAETAADVDDDAWEIPVQHLLDWTESVDQVSQELRLAGDRGAWRYLTGAYFLDMEAESSRTVASFFGQARADGRVDSRTWALFSSVGYAVSERLDAEVGVRWTRESKDLPRYTQDGGGVLLDFSVTERRTVSNVSPSVSLSFAVTDDLTTYARYAQGFKSGGFNVDLVTAPAMTPLEFDDERVDTVEAGWKARWLDDRLRLDLAAFHSTYRDLQVSQYEVLPGATLPTLRISNAASAHTQGVELTGELLLARWLLAASVGQTHSEVDDFPDPLGPGTGNYAGNGLGGPEWTTSLLAQHTRTLGWAELTLSAEHLFQDALGGDLNGDRSSLSDPLSIVNLRAELAFGAERRWRVRGWVDNVFDTERVVERHRHAAPGLMMLLGYPPEIAESTVGLYNPPRTFGVQLDVTL